MAAVGESPFSYRLPDMDRPMSVLERGVQITEFKEKKINPEPIVLEESDILLDEYLSPGKLRMITGCDNLEDVRSLEMSVNTCDTSLGNFGTMLPGLKELKVVNSAVSCIRDLGSSLRSLHILWMPHSYLQELDGISSMMSIRELYLSYNEIWDLSPLTMSDSLQILDLEGNQINDLGQIQYLTMCTELKNLTLDGNPICVAPTPDGESLGYDYRESIKALLPQLELLDDAPLNVASPTKKTRNAFDADWAYIEELQNDIGLNSSMDDIEAQGPGRPDDNRPTTGAFRPMTQSRLGSGGRRPGTQSNRPGTQSHRPGTQSNRPGTSQRPGTSLERPGSADQDLEDTVAAASQLTMGTVICGNPCKALRQRKKQAFASPEPQQAHGLFASFRSPMAERCYAVAEQDEDEQQGTNEVLNELRSWRQQHGDIVQQIEEDQKPQVFTVTPGEGLSDSDSDDESEGLHHSKHHHHGSNHGYHHVGNHGHQVDYYETAESPSADRKKFTKSRKQHQQPDVHPQHHAEPQRQSSQENRRRRVQPVTPTSAEASDPRLRRQLPQPPTRPRQAVHP